MNNSPSSEKLVMNMGILQRMSTEKIRSPRGKSSRTVATTKKEKKTIREGKFISQIQLKEVLLLLLPPGSLLQEEIEKVKQVEIHLKSWII
jgi:hypothetical protein